MQRIVQSLTRGAIVLVAFLALFSGAVVAAQIQASMGSVVTLSGYSYSGDTVYLFLTGPNLPPSGVTLDNIYRSADQGATQVQVDSDGHWTYKWNTGSAGGKLDAGVYTVWVTDGPADLSHLSAVDYNTISVVLSVPTITAGISTGSGGASQAVQQPQQPGSMDLSSIPDGASVTVDTEYKGTTPLTLSGLDPGTYNVTFSKFGYERLSTPVSVQSGSASEVNATLVMLAGSLFVNTTPAGARLVIDNTPAGISPATLTNLQQGNHTLNVTMDGFVPQLIPVQIVAGQTTGIDVNLAAVPAGIFGGTGTKAAGLLPATVLGFVVIVLLVAWRRSGK